MAASTPAEKAGSAAAPTTSWVLYNLAHAESVIKSTDGDAWLRVLGVFGSREAAQRHTRELVAHDRGIEIRVAPLGEFRMLLRSRYNDTAGVLDMATRERETVKHGFLLDEHAKRRRAAAEQTAANARERKMGELAFSPADRIAAYTEEMEADSESMPELEHSPASPTVASPAPALGDEVAATGGAGAPRLTPATAAPSVRALPPHLEVRMQKFMALAVVPDYEHTAQLDARLRTWEDSRDRAFSGVRNSALAAAMRPGDALPSPRDLLREWVCANPPPSGYNVWGQRTCTPVNLSEASAAAAAPAAETASGRETVATGGAGSVRRTISTEGSTAAAPATAADIWSRIPGVDADTTNTEAVGWARAFKVQYESALWPALGVSPPDRNAALRDWLVANPMPSSIAGAEPAVAFLHAGNTEEEVRVWIERESPTPRLRDFDIACVAMYEWIKVANAWSERVKLTYREPLMAQLHANKEAQRREAAALADAGVKVSEVSGGAALALAAPAELAMIGEGETVA
jgi:hypothetical protein